MPQVTVASLGPQHVLACEAISRMLPEWFCLEEGLRELCAALRAQRGWIISVDGAITGFVTVQPSFPKTREIPWLAVAPDQHRQGYGRRLIETVIDASRREHVQLLLFKTLVDQHPSPEYARTRAFLHPSRILPLTVLP